MKNHESGYLYILIVSLTSHGFKRSVTKLAATIKGKVVEADRGGKRVSLDKIGVVDDGHVNSAIKPSGVFYGRRVYLLDEAVINDYTSKTMDELTATYHRDAEAIRDALARTEEALNQPINALNIVDGDTQL